MTLKQTRHLGPHYYHNLFPNSSPSPKSLANPPGPYFIRKSMTTSIKELAHGDP